LTLRKHEDLVLRLNFFLKTERRRHHVLELLA